MQKVLVSAGAVGAAALELNNNQATEVVEAAPHGVQQRRRSQSKKEEPAVLIKRGHTVAKSHHGNRASVQNAGQVFWIVFGILAVIGLALGLGLGLGLNTGDSCPDISKAGDNACICGGFGPAATNVLCTLTTKDEYEKFEAAKCTSIDAKLDIDALVAATGANAVEKAQFKTLISAPGVTANAGTWTTKQLVFKMLVAVTGANQMQIGGGGDVLETLKAGCVKTVGGALQLVDLQNVKSLDYGNLETVTGAPGEFNLLRVGTKHAVTFDFRKVKSIAGNLAIDSDSVDKKQKFEFTHKGLQIGANLETNVALNAGKCVTDVIEVCFADSPSGVFVGGLLGSNFNAGDQVGKYKFGSKDVRLTWTALTAFQGTADAVLVAPGGVDTGVDTQANFGADCPP